MAKRFTVDTQLNYIQRIMDEENISGKELAISSGLSEAEISNIKNFKRIPTQVAMLLISRALNREMNEVFETNWKNVNFM